MVLCCPFEFTKILVIALHWDLCLAAKCDLDGHVLEGLTYNLCLTFLVGEAKPEGSALGRLVGNVCYT